MRLCLGRVGVEKEWVGIMLWCTTYCQLIKEGKCGQGNRAAFAAYAPLGMFCGLGDITSVQNWLPLSHFEQSRVFRILGET